MSRWASPGPLDAMHVGHAPWDAWLARTGDTQTDVYLRLLNDLTQISVSGASGIPRWASHLLGITTLSSVVPVQPPVFPFQYLSDVNYVLSIENIGCPETPVRLCVEALALEKCNALSQVLTSKRVRPHLTCVVPPVDDHCMSVVEARTADITTADGADLFKNGRYYFLIPLVTESRNHMDASYFAVAVVKKGSAIYHLSELRGRKSCHAGIGRNAGWKIPIGALLEDRLLIENDCDYPRQISQFFSASCVPGALDPLFNRQSIRPNLCALCVGTPVLGAAGSPFRATPFQNQCARDSTELYSDYDGALRCLTEGGGDVAFLKHTTLMEYTDGSSNKTWARGLRLDDFRLLCRDFSYSNTYDYVRCHLARVPAQKVVTSYMTPSHEMEQIRLMLLKASDVLPKGQDSFALFGPFEGINNLIFKDTSTELVNIEAKSISNSLDDHYYQLLKYYDLCSAAPVIRPVFLLLPMNVFVLGFVRWILSRTAKF